ncbi:MAG: gliding motility-associated C-terminal domain-containing protein [Paludibacteraceae bacterium]|nr:gliding motility-associated C-terminal domain-containing protein [Paludibacteraceae bacterium]
MKLRIISAIVALMVVVGLAYGDNVYKTISPAYETSINGGIIFIGTSNTTFKDTSVISSENEGNAEIEHIKNLPTGEDNAAYTNSNYVEFCIPGVDEDCDQTTVSYARLSWNGGGLKPTEAQKEVTCFITDEAGTVVSKFTASSKEYTIIQNNFFYSYHANVTSDFAEAGIKPDKRYRIYVTDLQTTITNSNKDATKNCTGWSLSLIYKHNLLPKRTILLYDCDVFGESGNATSGKQGDALFCNFSFGSQTYNIDKDSITFGHSSLGTLTNAEEDYMKCNRENKTNVKDLTKNINNSYLDYPTIDNLRNSIFYQYNSACGISSNIKYTRSYGLNVGYYKMEDLDMKVGDKNFNMCITGQNEHHFLTNAFIMFGSPDVPETTLPMEIEGGKTSLSPNELYTIKLYVAVGDNKEGLKDIKVDIPFSEYIDSITAFKITPIQELCNTYSGTAYAAVDKTTTQCNFYYYRYNYANYINDFESNAKKGINTYLSQIDMINDANYVTNPSRIQQRKIQVSFPGLTIPQAIKNKNVIEIKMTLHTKPADNWVYSKTSYIGRNATLAPQAELTLTTETGETSIYESTNNAGIDNLKDYFHKLKCDKLDGDGDCYGAYCSGGGGGGAGGDGGGGNNCSGLGGGKVSKNGVFKDNSLTKQIEISIIAKGECRAIPDTIEIPFCDKYKFYVADFDPFLKTYYDFNIDSIAKVDSCIWEGAKRDALIDFAVKYGVNKSRLEALLGSSNLATATAQSDFKNFLTCEGVSLSTDSIDSIVNMKRDFSKLMVIYEEKDTTKPFKIQKGLNVKSQEALTTEITIEEETTTYLFYDSPWVGDGKPTCDSFIVVEFKKLNTDIPTAVFKGDTIQEGETIYSCLGKDIAPINVTKGHNNFDVFATITGTDGTVHPEKKINIGDKIITNPLVWEITKDPNINTSEAGIYKISLVQRDYESRCISEPLNFKLEIIDIKIDEKPEIDKTNLSYCQSLKTGEKGDSIKLWVNRTETQKEFGIRWFNTITSEVDGETVKTQHKIGETDTIYVRRDSAGTFEYNAEFYVDQCPSEQDEIFITVFPYADTLKTDTITICKYYKPSPDEIIGTIRSWNGTAWNTSNVLFYEYDASYSSDTTKNLAHAISKDSLGLNRLIDKLKTEEDCPAEGYYFLNFVVQGKTAHDCVGAGSLVTIKVNCYDRTKPSLEDSTLYCTGDTPSKNLNDFLNADETDTYKSGYKWYWKKRESTTPLPNNAIGSSAYATTELVYNPETSTAAANSNFFVVTRIDSNNCVSLPDTFHIVVADAINSYAKIGDTTSIISTTKSVLPLNYCKGNNPYSNKVLPTVGYPSRDYIMEWYRKDKGTDECDSIAEHHFDRLQEEIEINFEKTDTTYFCTRQTTVFGCKGPWLTVSVIVHDSVREKPIADTTVMCEGADPVTISVINPDPSRLNLYLYNSDTVEIKANQMLLDTVAGQYLTTLKKNIYFASLKDDKTGCYGDLVGINAIVNPKPHLPMMNKDTTIYLCATGDAINLAERVESKINTQDINTAVIWTPKDEIITSQNAKATYYIHQKDTITHCEGNKIEITVKVENTFKYSKFGRKDPCFGETVSLRDTINRLLSSNNQIIEKEKIGFKVFALHNNVKGIEIKDPVQSSKSRYLNDTTYYLVEILDTISGCAQQDTATIIFHGLPNEKVEEELTMCQNVELELPTPTNKDYSYVWRNAQNDIISGTPAKLLLIANEKISLTETNKIYGCKETFEVDITVFPTPDHAISKDTAFCQNGTELKLAAKINATNDGYNTEGNLSLQWFNERLDSISNPIKTDTIIINDLIEDYKYTLRQTNTKTRCFRDTTITLSLRKNIRLDMADLDAVCEPDVVDFVQKVDDYIFANIANTNLVNTNGLRLEYAKLINGNAQKLSTEEAKALSYTNLMDKVDYIYIVTDAKNICSTSDTVTVTINQKPSRPIIENGLDTVFFCKDDAPIWLHAFDTNADTTKTDIFWGSAASSADSIDISIYPSGKYTAYSKNIFTGCVSVSDTIMAYISNSIEFDRFSDTINVCHNETVNLVEEMERRLEGKNLNNYRSKIGYKIWALIGSTPNPLNNAEAIAPKSVKTVKDVQRFYVEVLDSVSGCFLSDTATVVFHELPTIEAIDPIVICQYQDTLLIAPNDSYKYEWFREEGSMIPSPEKLQLENSETIKLVATDKNWGCVDSIHVKMDVKRIPEVALAEGATFCQNSGSHPIVAKINASQDNAASDLSISWMNSDNEVIETPINTDTIVVSGLAKKIHYTIRQTNKVSGCYKDTVIEVTVNKALNLAMDDIERICQPDSIAFKNAVEEYLYTNASNVNLPNVQGIQIDYARLDNGNAVKLTDAQVTKLGYIDGRDSVAYIYTVTDAENVCSASDTVTVTINQKPSRPIIENGLDTVFFCKDDAPIWLHAFDTNADTTKTDIFWGSAASSADSIDISIYPSGKYTAYSKNIFTGCVSVSDTIMAYISNSIEFDRFSDTINVCHNETVNLVEEMERRLEGKNLNNYRSKIGYKIWALIGSTPNPLNNAEAIAPKSVKTVKDVQRFYVEVLDSVSGCFLSDTATVVFHELPTIEAIDPIVICQYQDTLLIAPNDSYKYEWFREEGSMIPSPEKLQLENSETIKLVATDKNWGCVDSIHVKMDVKRIPEVALAEGATFCQNSGSHPIVAKINASQDNAASDLSISWMNSDNEVIETPINTDTIVVSGLAKKIHYTIRQTNKVSGCYKDTVIEVTVNKALNLAMDDIERICQPDSIAFKNAVEEYLYTNASNVNLPNVQGIQIDYARLDNGNAVKLTDAQVTKLGYIDGRDSVAYIYTVTDAENVCSASDTVTVTINQKPSRPIIENGLDSIFFCGDLAEIKIGAKDINPNTEETKIFWGETTNATEGDSLNISAKEKRYTAFTQNILTECVSDLDTIVAVISDPIQTSIIGENGIIELCAGEHINVTETAQSSFRIYQRWNSEIVYSAKVNGNITNIATLSDVSRNQQDTIVYEFNVIDKLTGCEAKNNLTLIFHQKPTFEIEGKKTICQADELELSAVGESRATSYTWQFVGSDLIESSSDKLNKKGLMQDTTIMVIAHLNGTSCIDTLEQLIQINETPKKLTDQEFDFCQNEERPAQNIQLDRTEYEKNKFSLLWYDANMNEISNDEELMLSIANDTTYKLIVKQVNEERDLTCQSEASSVTVNVNKHINVALRDTNICMPEKFNLAKYAKEEKIESTLGYKLNVDQIFKIEGSEQIAVSDASQIEASGLYHIIYTDKSDCETTADVSIKFINKPATPIFDETMPIYLCQGIDTTISPKFIAGDYEYIWDKTGSNETLVSDTLKINATLSNGGSIAYKVWRRDTIYGCESEKAEVSYQILDSIHTNRLETIHLCESESIDLDSVANIAFSSDNELKNNIFHSDAEHTKGNQLLYSNAVSEEGFYLIEAQDMVSGCSAKNIVEIAIHSKPTLLYKGETELCDGSDVLLTAYPKEGEEAPEYQWTDANEKSINDSVLSFTTKLASDATEAKKETLKLTGTYHITNKKACVSNESVEITTHPIPPTLPNDTIDVCQNTGSISIQVDYQDNVFNLKRYDSEGNEIEKTVVNTDSVTNVRFAVMQEDRITKCKGKEASIFVNVRQSIELHIDEPTAVCAPSTINLTEIVNKAATESNASILEKKLYEVKSISHNGSEVETPNAINQSGTYQVVINDQYGCQARESVQFTIHQQPQAVSGDTSFCQGIGIQTLAGKGTSDDLILEWLDLATAYPDSVFTDSLKIKTDKEGDMHYLVRQTTLSSHCSSEATPMTVTIHPAIVPTLKDTMICHGTIFDIMAYAERQVTAGTNPYLKSVQRTEPILPIDYNAIKQGGRFIARYADAHQCEASDTMTLSYADKIEIALDYTKEVCAGDTIKAKASGAEHFIWNGNSNDIDSIFFETSTEGIQEIMLTASNVINTTEGTSCSIDTTFQVTINKVPSLISGYNDTLYCQGTQTEALSLQPTEEGAIVLWYDPNDNYSTVSKNGTLKPSSLYAGEYTYKFRQQLGECQTKLQDYTVNIQSSIEEKAIVSDTAYCKDEATAPLLAKWSNPLYEVIWTDEEGNQLDADFRPSSEKAGEQQYQARLSYKACQGDASTLHITIQEKYDRKPEIDEQFIFCENTGIHTIKANSIDNGARLNWYAENSNVRLDSIVINTNESQWKNAKFIVTQSVINGCESPSSTFDVSIKEAIQPLAFSLDTCAGSSVSLAEIMEMQNITDKADTLWNGMDKSQRMDLNSNIGYTGDYQFSVTNQYGCKATHTAHINMLKVEDLDYTTIKSIYCYDDTVSLNASASNADIEWENVTEGLTHYGRSYNFTLNGATDVTMTATIINKPVCKETIDFKFETYKKTEAIINGETNVCLGNTITLNTSNLYNTQWSIGDSVVTSDEFSFTPSKSEILTINGVDENQCPVKSTLTINTVKQPDPTILVVPMIHSSTYHLNRDTFEVHLEAALSSALDENYTYKWDFGDGTVSYGSSEEDHEYQASLVRLTKPIDVTITVEHAYGCSGATTTKLLVDPDFDVPNTMTPEDDFMADYDLQIFDRIGNLIYEGRGWHGQKNNGEDAFGDTYFYAITYYISGEKKIKTGYITLVR